LINWEKTGRILYAGIELHANSNGETYKDFKSASSPWVYCENGKWYMYYVGAEDCSPEGIPAMPYHTLLAISDSIEGPWHKINEEKGKEALAEEGVSVETIEKLSLLGISSISNLLTAIKTAKYYEFTSDDIIFSVATDSADLYQSRIGELNELKGEYTHTEAYRDLDRVIYGAATDHLKELTYTDKKAIHNLKYFTWVEQQKKAIEDLHALWYDREFWDKMFSQPERWDELINEFNERTGLLKR